MSDNPKSTVTRLLGTAALAVCALLGVVAPAAASMPPLAADPASQGSVPSEVARYAADPDGLLARLDDLFGVTTSGQGIDFDDTTKVGQLNRAWVFTEGWLAGGASDDPVELVNLWTAPITIADKPVGLATIWINPATDAPDLADFDRSASSAQALLDVPAEAQLVRDEPRAAWFTLVEGQLTPLIAGDSGVDAATPLTAYQRTFTGAERPAATGPDLEGLLGAAIVAGAAVLVVLVVLLLPILRRHAGDKDPDEGLSVSTAAITLPTKAELRKAELKKAEREKAQLAALESRQVPEPEPAAASKVSVFAPEPEAEPDPELERVVDPSVSEPPAKALTTAKPAPRKPAAAKPSTPRTPAATRSATPRKPAAARTNAGGTAKTGTAKTGTARTAAPKATAPKTIGTKATSTRATTPKPATTKAGAAKKKPTTPPKETTTP